MDRIRITMFDISLMSLRNVRASFNCSARMSLDSLTRGRSEEHTSELQSHLNLVCRLLLEKKKAQYFRRVNAHYARSFSVLLKKTYQVGLRRDAVHRDIDSIISTSVTIEPLKSFFILTICG